MGEHAMTVALERKDCLGPVTVADRLLGVFAWGEVFVCLGLHLLWVLGKSAPLSVENTWGMLLAVSPFAVAALAGLAACERRFRGALLELEWLLHLASSALWTVLVVYVTLRDPFRPGLPHSWPFCLWGLGLTFALLGNVAGHLRRRERYGNSATMGMGGAGLVLAGLVCWAGLLWMASTMTWPAYYWTAAILLHALLAPVSRMAAHRGGAAAAHGDGLRERAVAGLEALLWIAAMLPIQLRVMFLAEKSGSFEMKWMHFLEPYSSPLFFVGVAVFYAAARWRFTMLTHVPAAAAVVLTGTGAAWPVALALGYGLAALFRASGRLGGCAYAVCGALTAGVWLLGGMGFSLSGMVLDYGNEAGFVEFLIGAGGKSAAVLLAAWLLGSVWILARPRSDGEPAPRGPWQEPSAKMLAGVFVALTALALLPALIVIRVWLWPPLVMGRADGVEIGDASGVCHAGYSGTDEEYALLEELGARMTRVDFHWHGVQPDPDTWDFSRWDRYMDAADRHGMRVLALLVFGNTAVETSPKGRKTRMYIAPEDVPLYLEYVRRIVTRYKDRVYAWEIWNEADVPRFWDGPTEEFYELAKRAAETLYEIDPSLRVVGTSMTGPLGSWTPRALEGLYRSGAMERVDHPSWHLYVSDPRAYYNEFRKAQLTARKHGHPGALWITELGDPDGGIYPWRASSDLLAEHAMKSHAIALSMGFENLVWYCLRDGRLESQMQKSWDSESFFGLLGPDDQWKPAAYAYRLFNRHCSHSVSRPGLVHVTGGVGARQLRTALFRRDSGESALAMWYEPQLRPGAKARAYLDVGATAERPVQHDITSDYTKILLDDVVDVCETPLFFTFRVEDLEQPIHIRVSGLPLDGLWLLGLAAAVLGSAAVCGRMRGPAAGR